MNDSKDFQDAENQFAVEIHTLPFDQCHSHLIQFLDECLAVLKECRAAEKGRQAFGTHMVYRETFLQIQMRHLQHLILRNWIHGVPVPKSRFFHSQWKRVRGEHKIKIRDASLDSQPNIQSSSVERLFKEFWCRPTTTADFRSSFRQIPYTSHVCLLEDRIQDWGMYLLDQRSGDGWFSGWLMSSSSTRGIQMPNFEALDARIASALNRIIQNTRFKKKRQFGGTQSPNRGPLPPRKTDLLPDLRVLPGHWSRRFRRELCRPIYSCSSKWRYSGIRFEMGRNFIINDANPILWNLGKLVQIKNTRVWETQDRIGIVKKGDSSEENRTWLSQIENEGKKKYRAEVTNEQFWGQKRKLWNKRRGQESGNKTARTKNSWRLLAMESQRAVFWRRQLQFPTRYE